MPSFFVNTFKKAAKFSPESQAIKRATLLIDQAKTTTGFISDPAVYDKANAILEPYSYDTGVLTKMAQNQAAHAQLLDKLNDQQFTKNKLDQAFQEGMYGIGKNNFTSPQTVVQKTAMLYDLYASQLKDEITSRIQSGESYDTLIPLQKDIQEKTQSLADLSRAVMSGNLSDNDKNVMKQQFGFVVKTNPANGKIISFALQPTDTGTSPKGTFRTDSTYGGVPVYVNAVRDPNDNNNYVARLGNAVYKGKQADSQPEDLNNTDTGTQGTLKQTELQLSTEHAHLSFFGSIENAFKGQSKLKAEDAKQGINYDQVENTKAGNKSIDGLVNSSHFQDTMNFPTDSVAQDSKGNFYYINKDGKLFQAGSPEVLGKQLNMSPEEVKSKAYFLTTKDLKNLSSQQDPNTASDRVIKSQGSPINQPASGPIMGPPAPKNNKATSQAPGQGQGAEGTPVAGGPAEAPTAIKKPGGQELAQKNTDKITSGAAAKELAGGPAVPNIA